MAKKGKDSTLKRISSPGTYSLPRKGETFVVRPSPGRHSFETTLSIAVVLRDLLKVARNLKEVKFILNKKTVKVDGKIVTDYSFPVGLFDVIDIEQTKQRYRLVLDTKGRLNVLPIDFKLKLTKLCKILRKKQVKGKKLSLAFNDGRNVLQDKTELNVNDTVKFELPGQKILEAIPLQKNSVVYLVSGKHVGRKAVVKELIPGTQKRKPSVALLEGDNEFQTLVRNIFVVGKDKIETEL